jgi:hypothetical protein
MQMTTRRPTFRWTLPSGYANGHAQICSDAACANVIGDLYGATGASTPIDLPPGAVFWHVAGQVGTNDGTFGPTWDLFIPQTSAPHESSPRLSRDLNGDGLGDIALTGRPTNGSITGVYFGRSPMPSMASQDFDSPSGGYPIVPFLGDYDGDGFADLGSFYGDQVAIGWGRVSGPNGSIIGVIENTDVTTLQGFQGLGDLDGDGRGELAFADEFGELTVFPGGAHTVVPSLITSTGTQISSPTGDTDGFGTTMTPCGDIDGDGYGDVAIAAPRDANGAQGGAVYVFTGSATGLSATRYTKLVGAGVSDGFFGAGVDSADIDHDGFPDLIVGAPEENFQDGNIYVFRGTASGISAAPAWTIHGAPGSGANFTQLGSTVVAADFDGDGYGDIAATELSSTGSGSVLVFRGSATGPSSSAAVTIAAASGSRFFGQLMSTPLDATGAGYADLVISDGDLDGAYFYAGSATGLPATPTETLTGPAVSGFLFFAN